MMVVVVKLVTVAIRTIMFSLVMGGTVIGVDIWSLSGISFGKDEESSNVGVVSGVVSGGMFYYSSS